jgi:hypothetical protein
VPTIKPKPLHGHDNRSAYFSTMAQKNRIILQLKAKLENGTVLTRMID